MYSFTVFTPVCFSILLHPLVYLTQFSASHLRPSLDDCCGDYQHWCILSLYSHLCVLSCIYLTQFSLLHPLVYLTQFSASHLRPSLDDCCGDYQHWCILSLYSHLCLLAYCYTHWYILHSFHLLTYVHR